MKNPITPLSKEYWPKQLFEIPKPPTQLFIQGTLPKRDGVKWLTVVGARNNSKYGALVCKKLITSLKHMSVVIISGLARGIDTIALETALEHNIPTIVVPGSGLDDSVLYPKNNIQLAEKITAANNGCLLSEYDPLQKAELWTFPKRNRIMAGLSDAVLIVEAKEKSGTLITARLATDYNRDVLTIPGDIFSENTKGSHQLLRLGATPITCAGDLHEALGFNTEHISEKEKQEVEQKQLALLSNFEKELYRALFEQKTRDELFEAFPNHMHVLPATISMLLLKGVIEETGLYLQRA